MYVQSVGPMVFDDAARERRLWASVQEVTRAVVTSAATPDGFVRRELPLGEGQVDVYATVADGEGDEAQTVVVVVASPESRVPTCAELRRDFGLTKREAEVALLLAARRSNKEIATHLSIANKTAWRHTERVMSKLNTGDRRDVARVLLHGEGDARRRAPTPPAAMAALAS